MKRDAHHAKSWWSRLGRAAFAALVVGVGSGAAGCLSRPINPLEPRTTTVEVEKLTETAVDKIDLLLMIDNSASMADKQQVLADAVPQLVSGLLNPKCVDDNGNPIASQPASPTDMCPTGSKRDFNPVYDVHVGIVTSSLGSHGTGQTGVCDPSQGGNQNDAGHLIHRVMGDPVGDGSGATYQNQGFLQWDPQQQLTPPGVGDLTTMSNSLKDLVVGAGQDGCGLESQLESWYRFLVDPNPYASISFDGAGHTTQMGTDTTVIQERADFMRSDSLLAIIMLSDENDCSVKEYGFYPFLMTATDSSGNPFTLPRATKICETNPTDHCCASCGAKPSDCPADPTCSSGLSQEEDPINLRCWHNKQRFGIDFLYPIERYTLALTDARIPDPHAGGGADGTDVNGPLVENPIFKDLSGKGGAIRDPGLVFLAGIVGVPWQDIAVDPNDLSKGFKTSDQMVAPNVKVGTSNKTTWDVILGDPDKFVDPLDPHMIESRNPRSGTDPITGATIAPPNSPPGTDPLNGHEYDTDVSSQGVGDLEYACVFELGDLARDCSMAAGNCDCEDPTNAGHNPLCDTTNPQKQVRAKGYPGIRELQAIKSVGGQGIVGSICPGNITEADKTAPDYGYNPAVQGIINRLKLALGGQCLGRKLNPDPKSGQVSCLIIQASNTDNCDAACNRPGHVSASDTQSKDSQAIAQIKQDPTFQQNMWNCFCEIEQLTGNDLNICLSNPSDSAVDSNGQPINGWCYVDPAQEPTADPDIVKNCPDNAKQIVRFMGQAQPAPGSTVFTTCSGEGNQ